MSKQSKSINIIKYTLIVILILIFIHFIYNLNNENIEDMKFVDENNNIIDIKNVEHVEQDLANKYITSNSIVLELGARYGTVSCIISKKIKNSNNLVVVEPDDTIWESLEKNMKNNNCNFHIVKGVISNKKLALGSVRGYGVQMFPDNSSNIPNFSFDDIENQFNLKFNTLVADCEGCVGDLFNENPILYKQLELIILEHDTDKTDYDKLISNFKKFGFKEIENTFDEVARTVWKK